MADSIRDVAVVVRYTQYGYADPNPEGRIALMSMFADFHDADAEAARLNRVRPNGKVTYFVKFLKVASPLAPGGS